MISQSVLKMIAIVLKKSIMVLIMSTNKTSLGLLFGSKTRADLLAQFLLHPGESYYIRELAGLVGQSPTPVIRELSKLEQLGLVTWYMKANAKYYTVNMASFLFPELQSLILKTSGLGDVLSVHLKELPSIRFAFIYGSFADGSAGPDSDLDLMLIGNATLSALTKVVRAAEKRLGRGVQYSIFNEKEFLKKLKAKNEFIVQTVKGARIMLIGGEDEFGRFSKKGTD